MKKFQILVMLLWLSVCLAGAVESKIRLVHGPYLQNLGPDEVTIVWLSDKPSVGCKSATCFVVASCIIHRNLRGKQLGRRIHKTVEDMIFLIED